MFKYIWHTSVANFTSPAATVHVLLLQSWQKNFCMATILLFYIPQKFYVVKAENYLKIQNHTSFQDSKLSVTRYNGPQLQTFHI